ncbi:MAG: hypothetical protein K2W82_08810 [Candidatus Obscuribacterales bacterium]|nr:hypothetical protein [Candidatus Obscuribacterales bacterium]
MIIVELLGGIFIAVIIMAGIVRISAPITEAIASRLRPEQEKALQTRVSALEQELLQVREQMAEIQQSADFAVKLIEEERRNK